MSKRIHVVINPASGQPEPILHILNGVFRPAGVKWDVSITHEFGDATRQAREITIATDPPQAVIGDGEAWGETPISLKVLPGAVPVIAPPEVQG